MKPSNRILQIVHSLGMGGAETWLLRLLAFWKEKGIVNLEMEILVTSGKPSILDNEFIHLGAKIHYISLNKFSFLSFANRFRNLLYSRNYIAIHDHQDYLSGWHLLAGIPFLPPVRIVHVHNPSYQITNNYGVSVRRRIIQSIGKRLVKRLATHIAGTSEKALIEYGFTKEGFPDQRIGAVYCGFKISDWNKGSETAKNLICHEFDWPLQSKIVLFAGRFDKSLEVHHPQNHKNSAFALQIFENCASNIDLKMIMVGENEHIKEAFLDLVAAKGLSDNVVLTGVRNDLPMLMASADILLFPSRSEGLGMVAVEAQASGLPVLASTGVPDECVVIKELVHFHGLDEPITTWSETLLRIVSEARKGSTAQDSRWEKSGFNIEISSRRLVDSYKRNESLIYGT